MMENMDGEKAPVKDASTAPTTVQDQTHKLRDPPNALRGWRLHVSMLGLCLGLFCSALETTIIATSLTAISTHFSDAARSTWIVTTYLVTYSGFLLVFSKLSDIFTPRNTLLAGLAFFALFSGLCAAARTMDQLIVFRALQGVGGSVIFSLAFVTVMAVCPMRWMGFYSGVSGMTFAVANVVGPLLGGRLGDEGAWKWIFLLNVPVAVVAAALVGGALPGPRTPIVLADLVRVDYVGAVLSVGGAVMLVYGLETGGSTYAWDSGVIVGVLVAAGVTILLFFGWEWKLGGREGKTRIEPLFPFRLLRNPVIVLIFLSAFFLGAVFYTVIINLPRRSQLLYSLSATAAGVKLLALLLVSSFCSAIAGLIYSKSTRLVLPILATTNALQVLGGGLLCTLGFSSDAGFDSRVYGYEVLIGIGFGFGIPTLMVASRVQLEDEVKDGAVTMGALNMTRTMGGPVALAVTSAIANEELPRRLRQILPADVVQALLKQPSQALATLEKDQAMMVRAEYSQVYRMEFAAVAGFAGLSFICAVLALIFGKRRRASGKHGMGATADEMVE
ncbi:Haloalkane dehalogenase [Lasiodiplodia theobromae]|uniref:Haloalkane dehalogenase n=1 Tax=Lasiodiplodia theobromae TaxID=45133 RepID=UPI0015C3D4B1|nr:Haloalkane dehalogenase [Lasiodiplodia theobromae]KAF4537715.1 Haloalkane dehalogenase [Lasiodiplodia theobromae]